MNVLDELIADHRRLDDLLIFFERELLAYEADEDADLQLMQDITRYYAEYFNRFHHPLEDCLFEHLLDDKSEQEIGSHRAIAQHDQLRRIADRLLDILDRPLHGIAVARTELSDSSRQFLQQNRDHIEHEEMYPFKRARRYLTARDWQAIDSEADSVRTRLDLEQSRRQYDAILASLRHMRPEVQSSAANAQS